MNVQNVTHEQHEILFTNKAISENNKVTVCMMSD